MRALLRQATTLRYAFGDESGAPWDPDGAITVAVTDGAGAAVSGSPFTASAEANATGVYTATLPARTQADTFTLSWRKDGTEIATDTLELVGSRLVDLRTLREDHELSTVRRDVILQTVESLEDEIADWLGWSPFLRGARLSLSGGATRLWGLPPYVQTIYSATSPSSVSTAVTVNQGGYLTLADSAVFDAGTWAVWLLYGRRAPADLVRAATILARYRARTSPLGEGNAVPERASVMTTASGTITFLTPDSEHPTGLHEVDGVLRRLREPVGV